MPYRNAWLWVLVLFALTFVAFWPGYFSKLPDKKIAHHYHAASSVLWMILAIAQSWTAHHNQLALHRKIGPTIFVLFPFYGRRNVGNPCGGRDRGGRLHQR